jgi:DNA-binding transcriptional MerR regulator
MPESPQPSVLPMGEVARRLGCKQWQVRRLFERNLLPQPMRVGAYRVVRTEDLPVIEQALRAAGYLKEEVAPCG